LKALSKLKKNCARDLAKLSNIDALLELASKQIDIPLHRLSNLLFEYDPAMHRTRVQKFIQNWEQCLEFGLSDDMNSNHKLNLRTETLQIVARPTEVISIQEDIFKYTNLHPLVLRLAALRSTTEATKLYAQAVSFVAKSMSINSDAPVFYQRERGELNNCIATLMFLARKQRAHSGFDLNQSCLAITRVHREAYSQQMSVNPAEQEEKQLAILDRRIRTLQELGNAVDGEKSEL